MSEIEVVKEGVKVRVAGKTPGVGIVVAILDGRRVESKGAAIEVGTVRIKLDTGQEVDVTATDIEKVL